MPTFLIGTYKYIEYVTCEYRYGNITIYHELFCTRVDISNEFDISVDGTYCTFSL